MWEFGLDSSGSEHGEERGFCEYANEHFGFHKKTALLG
jgi:hypothetical protein